MNRRSLAGLVLIVGVGLLSLTWAYVHWREHRFDAVILAAARRYGVEPAIVKAVVWRESRFDPRAVGRAGEMGLMQIRELAAVEWSSSQRVPGFEMNCLLDPGTNTLAGAWYLARVLRRYAQADDPLPYALADYNAGRNNVLRWNQGAAATNAAAFVAQIGFPSTRRYVQTVVRRRERYRDEFRSAP